MGEKQQANFLIAVEAKEMLEELASQDLRSLSAQVEWLIRKEHGLRQRARVLIDTPERYTVPEEA